MGEGGWTRPLLTPGGIVMADASITHPAKDAGASAAPRGLPVGFGLNFAFLLPISFRRRAFSLMKPAASFWS